MISLLSCGAFSLSKDAERDNEDAFLLPKKCKDGYLFAIADGVGSYTGAKEAAESAIQYLSDLPNFYDIAPDDVLNNIKAKIAEFASMRPESMKAATTLSYCAINSKHLDVIHVGDTRVYVKNGNKLQLLTKDHTQHQELFDEGLYTRKELDSIPGKNTLTSALSKQLPIRYQHVTIPIADLVDQDGIVTLFIMSDGAHHFWERRPRFSPNTLSNVTNFAASLYKRIQRAGPTDDYSLAAASFQIKSTN